jgi:APA family basic amino acid/polyamine antiporter
MEHTTDAGLLRGLRKWDLVALVINSVIGAGIFGLPSRAYALAGTYSLLAYVVSAGAIVLIIMCFAEVGSRFKATGGPYLYARMAFGPVMAFQVGWLMWLARIAGFAAVCNLGIGYLGYFVPAAAANTWRAVVIGGAVLSVAIVNVIGIRVTAAVTNTLTLGKLAPLFLFVVVGAFFVDFDRYSFATPPGYASFSQAALVLIYAYVGFEGAVIPAGEMRDPGRHVPFALLTGMVVIAMLYVLIQAVCIGTLPTLADSSRPLSDASFRFLGSLGASVIAAGALVSISGAMNALMFATPRLLFAMAENRQLRSWFLTTHARFHTPSVAIVLTAVVTLVMTVFTTFISALTISAVIRLIAYTTTCAALPVLRRNAHVPLAAFRAPGGLAISLTALTLSAWLLANSTWAEARLVAIASLIGFVLYVPCALRKEAPEHVTVATPIAEP